MTASNSGIPAAINSGIVEMPSHDVSSEEVIATIDDSDHNKNRRRFCFAPTEQAYNHGSDRVRPLRTMPFDSETWIGNLDNLGSRVWPHPSFNELLARSLTGDPRFPLPNTVAKENRFQSLRLRCCGEECLPTTHSPPVEYEKPSPLETLAFERTQNVIIYPFYVRLSKQAGLQRLFAIVHRHENGRYRFWKADGTYHEFYGLVKGSISMFPSPRSARSTNIGSLGSPERRSTSTSTKSSKPVAQFAGDLDDTTLQVAQEMRTLTRSGNMEGQLVSGQVEVPFADCPEPPSKRRIVAGSYVPHGKEIDFAKVSHIATPRSMAKPKQLRFRRPSATSARHSQPSHIRTQGPVRSLLHIKEACMLAYHLTGPALQLMYGNHAFTIESREGSLIDPTTDDPFLMTEQHAQYVLYSRQRSLKVILSKEITRSINESADRMTGGVVLLEFGGSDARDDFIARIKYMVGTVGGIGCADDFTIESTYGKHLEQFSTHRMAKLDSQDENAITDEKSAEQIQSFHAKMGAENDGGEAASCPPALTETSSYRMPATPVPPESSRPPTTPASCGTLESSIPVKTSASPSISQAVAIDSIAPPASQAQDTNAMVLSEPKISTSETTMKELSILLREVYVKYPDAQDDDEVEKMALLLKASLLAGDQERVRELKMDLKVYLITRHG